jgi:hypothetical protein
MSIRPVPGFGRASGLCFGALLRFTRKAAPAKPASKSNASGHAIAGRPMATTLCDRALAAEPLEHVAMTTHTWSLAPAPAGGRRLRQAWIRTRRALVHAAVIFARARIRRACIEAEMVGSRWNLPADEHDMLRR